MNEKDKNIYVNYEKYEDGKFINPISVSWNGFTYNLSSISGTEIMQLIKNEDPNMMSAIEKGDVKRINRVSKSNLNSLFNKNILNSEKKKKPNKITLKNIKDIKRRIGAGLIAIAVLTTSLVSCSKKNDSTDNLVSVETILEEDTLKSHKEVVEKTMENFSKLSEKYSIDGKEYFVSAEEWLTAYLYTNSYELTVQELLKVLKGSPNFYSKMSDNYRLFNEKMMTFNIISDEPAISKDFFKNEECYNIYLNYFNTFKKAQKEPSKENKFALEELTKEIYGLTDIDEGLESIYEKHPDVASIIGHTLVVPGMMMNLITQETYDNAMGIYNYDKDGNLLETHGPIEWATCNDIEMEVFDRLETVVITSGVGTEDILQPWFDELNEKYEIENLITTKDALKHINELRFEIFNNSIKYDSNNTTTITESSTTTIVVDPSEISEEEKKAAEEEADKDFEEQYGEEEAKEAAYGAGMSDAMGAIEVLLAKARQNEASANSISSSDITATGNNLKNSYTGNYKEEYAKGVDVAVSYGISELSSIKEQYKSFEEEVDEDTEVKEEEIETPVEEPEEEQDTSEEIIEEEIVEEEIIDQGDLEDGNISYIDEELYEEVIVEEEILTQEELEQEQKTTLVRVR